MKTQAKKREGQQGAHSCIMLLPGDLTVKVETPIAVFHQPEMQMIAHNYLPGLQIRIPADDAQDQAHSNVTLTVTWVESPSPSLRAGRRHITLFDRFQGQGSCLDLINLIYSACRLLWHDQGIYSLHSACLSDADREGSAATLLIGHSGTGKTSLALELARRGGKIFSGNRTLVAIREGKLVALAGTRTMTRSRQTEEQFESAAPPASEESAVCARAPTDYLERRAYSLAPDAYESRTQVTIATIALARLNDGAAQVEELESLSALHRLFPYFTDAFGADTVLADGALVFVGSIAVAPMKAQRAKLSNDLAGALKSCRCLAVSGSLGFVAAALCGKL
ncbi:MAG: ATP-binding protein [Candidatus Obscuribacter sp.]|nr:ATP-binding protein [Candidatus Obscuribacter sp.]